MTEESVFKAEEARKLQRQTPWSALALIGLGGFLLVSNLVGIEMIDIFWPLFVIIPGLLLLLPAHNATAGQNRRLSFLAVPGTMLVTIGTLLFAMNMTDHFEAWAYSWTLVLAAAAAGLMYKRRFEPEHPGHERGRRFMRTMVMLFIGLAVLFEIVVFESFQPWLPLALIAYGVYVLVRNRRQPAVKES